MLTAHYIVTAILIGGIFAGLGASLWYQFSPYEQRSKLFFGGLLAVFSLALVRIIMMHEGVIDREPINYFLPVWYTLSFGMLLFFSVKLRLYPTYKFRSSDAKHFILPLLQAGFLWSLFLSSKSLQNELIEPFVRTYYKPMEGAFFILLFFTYMALAFRYLKYKQAILRKRGKSAQADQLIILQNMLKMLYVLGGINTFYILADFIAWQFFSFNLYSLRGFASINDLSFVAMVYWLAWFVLIESRTWKAQKALLNDA